MCMCNGVFLVAESGKVFKEKENMESKMRATDEMKEFETENEGKIVELILKTI